MFLSFLPLYFLLPHTNKGNNTPYIHHLQHLTYTYGVRNLKRWSLAFMAKLGWKILTQLDKLRIQNFKTRYLKYSNFLDCNPTISSSPLWKDILKGRDIIKKGLIINIGNGEDPSLWYHHWVGDSPLYKIANIRIPESKAHWRVSNIIKNNNWDLS